MRFKVGDKAKVKENLRVGKIYDGIYFSTAMDKFKGKVVEIVNIFDNYYGLKEDEWNFYFSDNMLEPVFAKEDLRIGDRITLRNGMVEIWDGSRIGPLDYEDINDNLTNNGSLGSNLDIVKVERKKEYKTIYEREKARKMTVKEISEALGYEVEVVDSHE